MLDCEQLQQRDAGRLARVRNTDMPCREEWRLLPSVKARRAGLGGLT